jgi:RND family efflux transporter MFP subunit
MSKGLRCNSNLARLIAGFAALQFASASTAAAAAPSGAPAAVAVAVAPVRVQDLALLTTAIGTVQSLQNDVLKPQIDGVLTTVLVREGQVVKRGQLLATIDDRPQAAALEQARAARDRDAANLRLAELDLARDQRLLAGEAISSQAVDQQSASVEQLRATLRADEANIHAAEVQLSYTRIVSPVTGRVGMRRVDPGNLVHANDAGGLFSVAQTDPISVIFAVPQQDLGRIQPLLGHPEQVQIAVLDRDLGARLASGHLMTFDNQIDSATGTFSLRGVFPNARGVLWPGEFVTVELPTKIDHHSLVVDARALQQREGGNYVYRVVGGKAVVVPVIVAAQTGGVAEISSGLKEGDSVVVDGQSQLTSGATVRIVADTAAASAGQPKSGIEIQQ